MKDPATPTEPSEPTGRLARALGGATALVSALGLGAELAHYQLGLADEPTELFSLSYEGNLPTWYGSALLLTAGILLVGVADHVSRSGGRHPRRWWLLAALFVYMSLDEAIEIHEYLVYLVPFETGGVLYFAWVLPAAVLLLALGAVYLPFLRGLPARSRWRFSIAGAIFVGGALGMELPLGAWTDQAGQDNLVYGLLDWVEETLELVGVTLFVVAVVQHRRSLEDAPADDGATEAEHV